MNRNVVAILSHNEYKYVLLNNKYIRHSMNIIQSKDHRIGNMKYEHVKPTKFHCLVSMATYISRTMGLTD